MKRGTSGRDRGGSRDSRPDPRGARRHDNRGTRDDNRGTRDDNRGPRARDDNRAARDDNRGARDDNRGTRARDDNRAARDDNRATRDDGAHAPTTGRGGKRPTLRVTKPLRDAIRAGHPWVYDRAVAPVSNIAVGELVTLVDDKGPIATALVDPTSPIRARVLDVPDAACDGTWAAARAEAAAARRARDPLLVGCTGRRLVHGEADGCPGLVIDAYTDTAVIVFDGPAATAFWRARIDHVLAGLERGGATIAHVWLRGERRDRTVGEALRGAPPAEIVINEDEARFGVDVRSGQKTGFFLDQRDNRRTIRKHAAGASVLNLFAYTGGFSLHAALGGATRVTSVDIAPPAIAAIERNVILSGLDPAAHERVAADAFEFLERARAQGRRWDLVIVDPPSFAPSERAKPAALKAYERLAVAGLDVVEDGGRFALASCSSHVTEVDLLGMMAGLIRPNLRLRSSAGAASDHPVLAAFSEGRYLKFLFFDVG